MNKMMDYKKMENEIDKYFDNLTDEQFMADLEAADYSFYKGITVEFLGGLDTTQVTYGQINISTSVYKFTKTEIDRYKIANFAAVENYDYLLAA